MTTPWIVLATIIGYFILLFVVSWLASRKSDANTALTGGREAPWYIVAIAMIGAPISGVTFVSVPGLSLIHISPSYRANRERRSGRNHREHLVARRESR